MKQVKSARDRHRDVATAAERLPLYRKHATAIESEEHALDAVRLELESRSTGAPLPRQLREAMEDLVGVALKDVRVHTDGSAQRMARAVGADAFALGRDVFFGAGKWAPTSPAGLELIAHEVAHASEAPAGRRAAPPVRIESVTAPAEVRADRVASDAVARGLGDELRAARGTVMAPMRHAPAVAQPRVLYANKNGKRTALDSAKAMATTAWMNQSVVAAYKAAMAGEDDSLRAYEGWSQTIWNQLGLKDEKRAGKAKRWFDKAVVAALKHHFLTVEREANSERWVGVKVARLDQTIRNLRKSTKKNAATKLAAAEAALTTLLASHEAFNQAALKDIRFGEAVDPSWLAGKMWQGYYGMGKISQLPKAAQGRARRAMKRLTEAMVSPIEMAGRRVEQAAKGLEPQLKVAATAAVEAAGDTWIEDLAAFSTTVVETLRATPDGQKILEQEGKEDWIKQNGVFLRGAAEVELIRTKMSRAPNVSRLTVGGWLNGGRSYNTSMYSLPTWRFYEQHIDRFRFMKWATGKANGLHKDVAARLPETEARIKRYFDQAPASEKQGTEMPQIKFFGFRFQTSGAGGEHPRGRAFDMQAVANPFVKKDTHKLVSLLTGVNLAAVATPRGEINAQRNRVEAARTARLKLQTEAETLESRAATLRQELAAKVTMPDERAPMEGELQKIEERRLAITTELQSVAASAVDGGPAGSMSTALQQMRVAQGRLKSIWADLTGGDPSAGPEVIAPKVIARLTKSREGIAAKQATEQQEIDAAVVVVAAKQAALKPLRAYGVLAAKEIRRVNEERKAAGGKPLTSRERREINKRHKSAYRAAKSALSGAKRAHAKEKRDVGSYRARLATIDGLVKKLGTSSGAKSLLGKTKRDSGAPKSIEQIARKGMTNQPIWLIQGFAASGWRWGGAWASSKDSMHFEYNLPAAGLKAKS